MENNSNDMLTTQENITETAESVGFDFAFVPDSLSTSLPIMGKGMLGILIVIVVIMGVVALLNAVGNGKKKDEESSK